MYVVIHFWTYFHFEWLINSTFLIGTIVRLVFEFWNFPSNFVAPRAGCPQSRRERRSLYWWLRFMASNMQPKTPTNMNVSFKWRKWMWYIWYGYYFPLHHTLYSACDEGLHVRNVFIPNGQRSCKIPLDHLAPWFKPSDNSIPSFPFCTTTHPTHAHFSIY